MPTSGSFLAEGRWSGRLAPAIALGMFALGGWVLGEWAVGSLRLAWIETRFLAMAPGAALGFMLAAALLFAGPHMRAVQAHAGWAIFAATAGLGNLWVIVHAPTAPLNHLFSLHPPAGLERPYFGRLSPWSAALFLVVFAAPLLRFREGETRDRRLAASQGLSLALLLGAGLLIAGFGFETPLLQEGRLVPIAPPTALAFFLIALGQLGEGEASWLQRWLRSPTLFARWTRRSVPAALGLVILGGWITGAVLSRFSGEVRLAGAALVTLLTAGLLALLTGAVAREIQREVDRSQAALREREENFRITLNSIGDGVLSTDLQGRIVGLNPVAAELTGWSIETALGEPRETVVHFLEPPDRQAFDELAERVLQRGESYSTPRPSRLLSRDGTERMVSENAAPMRDEQGRVIGMVLVLRDMTHHTELEEKLRQSQKMDAVGQLAGGVAHDFNNMLTGIQGAAELLSGKLPKGSELLPYVRMIKDGAHRAADLTGKLLAFSRKGKVISTGVDVHEIIQSAVALLERSIDPRIRLETSLGARCSIVMGDPTMLQNVLLNLGVNARDAMPDGGSLVYATANVMVEDPEAWAPLFSLERGHYVEISVRDSGSGIPPAILGKIFEPFFTTKPPGRGTGLGLAAVFGAMKEHRGAVSVRSEEGTGTEFRLYLPVEPAPVHALHPPERELPKGEGRVLVIDDEPLVRMVAVNMLESLGYAALEAADGEAGIQRFAEHPGGIDLVVLDMVMPKLSGRETLQRLRELDPAVKVLLCSGFDLGGHLGDLMRDGVDGFLQKPYQRAALAEAVAKILGRITR